MRNHKSYINNLCRYLILFLYAFIILYPFSIVIFTALKTEDEIAFDPLGIPRYLHFENFISAWKTGHFGKYFINSIVVSFPITIGTVAFSSLVSYALVFLKMPGSNLIFLLFLSGLMIPFYSVMIPLYYILARLNLIGTYWAMVLPSIAGGLSFGVFYMRAFFRSIPIELLDAARIDGCNELNVLWKVILPIASPGITTLSIFNFMGAWNSFLIPLIYLQREELRPLVVGLLFFRGRYTSQYPLIMAGVAILSLPIIIVYIIFQRKFIEGLTAGAIKG
jgi:raffinose/stachyose/melibiose transport system permease protein